MHAELYAVTEYCDQKNRRVNSEDGELRGILKTISRYSIEPIDRNYPMIEEKYVLREEEVYDILREIHIKSNHAGKEVTIGLARKCFVCESPQSQFFGEHEKKDGNNNHNKYSNNEDDERVSIDSQFRRECQRVIDECDCFVNGLADKRIDVEASRITVSFTNDSTKRFSLSVQIVEKEKEKCVSSRVNVCRTDFERIQQFLIMERLKKEGKKYPKVPEVPRSLAALLHWELWYELSPDDNKTVLMAGKQGKPILIVREEVEDLLNEIHEKSEHSSPTSMYNMISRIFFWNTINEDLRLYKCERCMSENRMENEERGEKATQQVSIKIVYEKNGGRRFVFKDSVKRSEQIQTSPIDSYTSKFVVCWPKRRGSFSASPSPNMSIQSNEAKGRSRKSTPKRIYSNKDSLKKEDSAEPKKRMKKRRVEDTEEREEEPQTYCMHRTTKGLVLAPFGYEVIEERKEGDDSGEVKFILRKCDQEMDEDSLRTMTTDELKKENFIGHLELNYDN